MFWRRRTRLDEEMASHLEHETAENIARGMEPDAARRAALRTFGNLGAAREKARELDPLYWLDTLWQDTRFAFRLIARNPWVSLTIVATLTVGIGLNVSVFTVLNGFLLRPWVHSEPATFVSVIPRFSGTYALEFSDYGSMSQPDYVRYRDSGTSLESLAAYRLLGVTLSGAESGSIRGGLVSCNLLDVIRPGPPVLGRYLMPDECTTPMQQAVAVLSETAWRTRFNADPGVIGRVIHLNRIAFTVVGVAPGFTLATANAAADVWVPYTMLESLRPADAFFANPGAQWLTVVGRRRPDYALQQVQQELSLIARQADDQVPGRVTSLIVTDGSPVHDPEMRSRAPLIFSVTLGTTALLLVLACVNVTTLLLSRSAARQREIAVRLSLGAGRLRLLRQFLTESLVLSGLAAAFSFLIALRAPAALWYSLTSSPAPFDLTPDWGVLLYCLGVGLAVGVIAGVSPAVESLRPELSQSLKGSSTAVTPGRRRTGLRSILVAVQIALSLLLLVQVGLFTRAQRRFFSHDPGFETKQVLSVTLASVTAGFKPAASFYQELESRVKALPGVAAASYAHIAPWSGRNSTELSEIDGRPIAATGDFRRDPARRMVSPEYFAALGIPVTRGRVFTRDDRTSEKQVVPTVISEAMARQYWPGQDPVGHHFRVSALHEVIGVCRDLQSVRYLQDDGPFYYLPLDARQSKPPYMLVRVSGDPGSAAAVLRDIVRQIDPQMATTIVPLASIVEREGERLKPVVAYGASAGILALLLALTGVYSVVSFSVGQRVREIGIRMALGAQRQDVVSLVLRSGAVPVGGGLIAGIGLALAVSAGIESILYGVNPRDPLMLTIVPLLLLAAALGAIWIPARRAAALDPLTSLRYE
jgi:predicted permease